VYALDAVTGSKRWSYTAGSFVTSAPAVANGVVYVGSARYRPGSVASNVYALDASTGAKLWSYTASSWVIASPALADGMVYVGSANHKVYAFGL
jgi:outer membrane protein assembly factor BamB